MRLLPAIADATATVSAYGYVTPDQAQFLYVGLSITNNGDQPLTLQPATCAYTDDLGRRAAGAALFSGQTRLASATVAPGGHDDLQLGFPVLEDVILAQIQTITVDWTFTYAGRPYAAQAQFAKAAAGQVPPRRNRSRCSRFRRRRSLAPGRPDGMALIQVNTSGRPG